jgi:hypothetical protein
MGEDELYASFIARVNAAARLCALCPSVGAPTNAMYLEVLRDGLCDRLRQFCRNILQRDADIPFSELQEDLVQEERSYFSRRQGEYARLRTVPFVSPLISTAPPQMSQAKEQANVADDGSRDKERVCYSCGKVGHVAKNCPDTQREHGEKDQLKQEGLGSERKAVCRNFQRNGTCTYGKGCKFKHTRAPGAGTRNSNESNPVSPESAAASGSAAAIGRAAPNAAKGARLSAEEAARQIQEIMARVQCNVTADVARPVTDLPNDWFADEACDAAFVLETNGKFECADMPQGWDGFVDWFADEACIAVEVQGSADDHLEYFDNIPGSFGCNLDSNACDLFQGDQQALDEADQDRDYSRGFSPCLIDACDRAHVSVSQVSAWGQRSLNGDRDRHTRPTERDNSGGIPLDLICTPPDANVPVSSALLVPFPNLLGSAGKVLMGSVGGPVRARTDALAPGPVHAVGGERRRPAEAESEATGEGGEVPCGALRACPGGQECRSTAPHWSHDPDAPPPAFVSLQAGPLQVGPTPPWSTVKSPAPRDGARGGVVGPARGGVVGTTPALRAGIGGAGGVIRAGAGGAADAFGVGAGTGAASDPLPGAARRDADDGEPRRELESGRAE